MSKLSAKENSLVLLLRAVARSASIVCLTIIFLYYSSEGIVLSHVTLKEWIGFIFFPSGTFIGLILSWRKEGLGGLITVGSVLCFHLVYGWLLCGLVWQGWALLPFLIPGGLFLLTRLIHLTLSGNKQVI